MYKINPGSTDVLNTVAMKISEIYNTDENIGPAPRGACSKPASDLPASWVSSCKSQGKMKRTGNRSEKIGGKTKKVAGKRIKGKAYGGPLPDYSA
jgi:protein gp37